MSSKSDDDQEKELPSSILEEEPGQEEGGRGNAEASEKMQEEILNVTTTNNNGSSGNEIAVAAATASNDTTLSGVDGDKNNGVETRIGDSISPPTSASKETNNERDSSVDESHSPFAVLEKQEDDKRAELTLRGPSETPSSSTPLEEGEANPPSQTIHSTSVQLPPDTDANPTAVHTAAEQSDDPTIIVGTTNSSVERNNGTETVQTPQLEAVLAPDHTNRQEVNQRDLPQAVDITNERNNPANGSESNVDESLVSC
eukprot:Nitzschia sp. Nitz4//scaffold324_size20210//3971//4811//NITZ4_008697-RA/size20210-processed-gene-0.26-mRNA-1//-1//CDS//3329547883//5957//frame0